MKRFVSNPKHRACALSVSVVVWLGLLAGGNAMLASYAHSPGEIAAPETASPNVEALRLTESMDPLAVRVSIFVHPDCPCTAASLDELAEAVRGAGAYVALVASGPQAQAGRPALMRLEQRAQAEGWTLTLDYTGQHAKQHGARTSGHTVVYTPNHKLAFHGGVTASRGHRGPNPGIRAVHDLVRGQPTPTESHPVFGCPIFNESSTNPNACDLCQG